MATAFADHRRWTREEYERLVEQGSFYPGERVELLDGAICEMTPQTSFHAAGVRFSHRALDPLFQEGFDIRSQMPLALGLDSEPEPDLAVVPGCPEDYVTAHPSTAVLVVEVADSSLLRDRKAKAKLYARAGVPDYWILNLAKWCLEVYRDPKNGTYASRTVLREGDGIAPLARPEMAIPVARLLPRWGSSGRS
jgi:Uma2 family endonuclease